MELSKTQRSLFVIPSKWPPILLGLILGLFISAFFTSNFAITNTAPARISPSSYHSITTTTASINQLFIQLFFKSSHANLAQDNFAPSRMRPEHSYMPYLEESVDSSQSEDALQIDRSMGRGPSSKKQHSALNMGNRVEASDHDMDSSSPSQMQKHEHTDSTDMQISTKLRSSSSNHKSAKSPLDARTGTNGRPQSYSANSINRKCDISIGRWIQDDTYPLYDPGSCPFVDEGFNCHTNGRPDAVYTKWRWAPRDCDVPRFNGTDMLERLRGKRMVFVGDSLNRNQWESILCMLREVLPDKSRVVQVQGNHISKLPGGYGFKFLDYDMRVELYISQYLVDKQDASNDIKYILRLDKMDKLERRWRKANVLVFNTGHWWTSDKIGDGENCFQEGNEVYAKLDVMVAYNKALTTWANWVDRYINPQNTTVFFRGYSPVHYLGGQWNSGGHCENQTEPIYKESYLTAYPDKMQALESVVQGMRVPVHVLNITRLSDFRKDGHPAVFGHPPNQVVPHQDCSHWCLPGLPDTWNELLSFALFKQARSNHIK